VCYVFRKPSFYALTVLVKSTDYEVHYKIYLKANTVKPVLNGISRVQNIFPLKPGFRLFNVCHDSHGT
jgi:hypothetical protein